jgi:hypothetical protein
LDNIQKYPAIPEWLENVIASKERTYLVTDSDGGVRSVHRTLEQATERAENQARIYGGMMFFVVEVDVRAEIQVVDGKQCGTYR